MLVHPTAPTHSLAHPHDELTIFLAREVFNNASSRDSSLIREVVYAEMVTKADFTTLSEHAEINFM